MEILQGVVQVIAKMNRLMRLASIRQPVKMAITLSRLYVIVATTRIPDDCIDSRRYPLLAAREAMRQLVDDLLGRSILAPGAFS